MEMPATRVARPAHTPAFPGAGRAALPAPSQQPPLFARSPVQLLQLLQPLERFLDRRQAGAMDGLLRLLRIWAEAEVVRGRVTAPVERRHLRVRIRENAVGRTRGVNR